jgi:hypothetical protein
VNKKMNMNLLVSALIVGSLVSTAGAEETKKENQNANTSSTSLSEVQNKDQAMKSNDEEITNARLRATLGSKSRFSFKSDLAYSGGSIQKPFDAIRPNYRAGAQRESLAVLSGNVGVNFRLTDKDNLNFGTGLSILDPLHGDITKSVSEPRTVNHGDSIARYQVSTPFLSWSRGYKALGMQQVSGVTYSHFTDSDAAGMKTLGNLSISQTILANLGNSNLSGGVSLSADVSFFNGNPADVYTADMLSGALMRDDYGLGIYPFAEYSFNDKFSFRTVFGYFNFVHYKNEYNNPTDLKQSVPYQSMGLGISVTRDIYIYPNVQFVPRDIRADRTNVALSANISLF